MKVPVYSAEGREDGAVELPPVFQTPYRYDIIHKAYVGLDSHHFQPNGTHPTAGQDVSADSLDPPTGHAQSRVARIRGGGRRQGQAAEVASTRGGRQAHPPKAQKSIHKKLNRKENRLALCSAIAATASRETVRSRGHRIESVPSLPLIVSDDVESVSGTKEMLKLMGALGLDRDVERLKNRKGRSGKPLLRGRQKKTGKSALFIARSSISISKACGAIPGVEAVDAANLSVLDLAPGSEPARLAVYTRGAIEEIAKIKSPHLKLMAALQ